MEKVVFLLFILGAFLVNAYRILVGKRYYYRDISNTLNSRTIYAKRFPALKDSVYFK